MKLKAEISLSLCLLMGALILIALASPAMAAADDYQISYKWSSGKTSGTESFQPTNTSTLTYTVIANNSNSQIYFIANVTDDGGETKPGFNISGYPKTNLVSGDTIVAEIKTPIYDRNNGTLIIPLANAAQRFSIDLTIESDAATVYQDETNTIKAGLYVKEGDDYIPISNTVTSTANSKYPQLSSRGAFALLNPSLMPSGESEIDLKYVFYTTTDISSNWNNLASKGLRVRYNTFTLNFSDVNITADGITQNYSQWVAGGNSPVEFKTAATTGYTSVYDSDNLSIIFTPNNASYNYFAWNQTYNFSINTTDDFKFNDSVAPAINFTNLTVSADMKINSRGGDVQFTNIEKVADNNAAYLLPHYTAGTYTGASTDRLSSTLYTGSSSGLIVSNSESYDISSPFYYQELFKATFRNTIRNGSDETLTFDIPDGVTITHIRAPKNGTAVSTYDKISIIKDGKTYELDPKVSKTYDLSTLKAVEDGSLLSPYGSGEDVVLKIDKLVLIEGSTGGMYSYSAEYTISFVGTTDITPGTHSFKVSDESATLATRTFTAATDYIVSPYLSNTVRYLTNSDKGYTELPTLVGRGDTFYMYNTFYASGYPYGSALRVSPTNLTGIYSNPVLYFSVPVGLEIGTAQITDVNGNDIVASGAYKDINGKELALTQKVINNAGLYASQGGKLVEVKIHLAESGKENDLFWINGTARYSRLPVTVSQEYTGDSFDFKTNSVLVSSWDSNARYSSTGGAGGTNYNISADTGFNSAIARGNIFGSYPSYLIASKIYVQDDATVVSSAGVRIDSDYVYYNPSSEDSYPSLKAGSQNEMFKIYFYNGLGEAVGGGMDPATIYFVLPTHDDVWRASLMDVSSLDILESGSIGQYMIYYSIDEFGSDVGSLTLSDVNSSTNSSLTWIPITDVSDTDGIDWSNVTAIKCEIYDAADKSRFELFLPFELPPVGGTSVEFEQTAIGQTLYDVYAGGVSVLSSTKSYTAAIFLTESDKPEIQTLTVIPQGQSVEYKTGTIPAWYDVTTHDDFTENVAIDSISIVYTDLNGTNTTYPVTAATLLNRSTLAASSGFAAGYQYTINNSAENPVTNDRVGNYTIKYTTTPDDEGKVNELTVKFQITKAASTVVLNSTNNQDIFMNDEIPAPADTWAEHFRQFVSGKDMNIEISNDDFEYNESSTLDQAVPGDYVMIYDYTDAGLTTKSSSVNVAVKYTDELIVNTFAANSPVMDLTVSVSSDGAGAVSAAYDNDKAGYNATIKALKGDPTKINYTVTYSNVPAGLIDGNSGSVTGLVTYSGVSPVVKDLEFTPAKIIVSLDNASGIKSVSLYQVVDSGDLCIETIELLGDETSVSFETASGWFDDEEYYLTAELFQGYVSSSTDDFDEAGSLIYLNTSVQEFNNDDIELDLFIETSTLISGSVWNDSNRDSIMDETESGISAATVVLLNDDFIEIGSTFTDDDGYFYFIGLDEDVNYVVQVKTPSGFNHVSAFKDDQKINGSNNFRSEYVLLTSGDLHYTEMNAGFYYQSSGSSGGGTGNATVVDPVNPTTPMGGVEDSGNSGNSDGSENVSGYELPEIIQKSGNWWVLLLLLLVVIIAAGAVYYYKVKKNK